MAARTAPPIIISDREEFTMTENEDIMITAQNQEDTNNTDNMEVTDMSENTERNLNSTDAEIEMQDNPDVEAGEVTEATETVATVDAETDTEPMDAPAPKKKAARSSKKTAKATPEDEPDKGDDNPADDGDDTGEKHVSAEGGDNAAPAKKAVSAEERDRANAERRRKRARERRMNATLDADGNPILDGDGTFDDDLALIYQAKNTRKIVNGTIDEVKQGRGDNEGWVEVMYNGFRVLIPFSQMDIAQEHRPDEDERTYKSKLQTSISNMLGARIDFIINGVDVDERLATGSRAQATAIKRRDILNGTDRDGNYIVFPGRAVQATVLAVHPRFAFVDVFGYRTRLRARDIRSEYTEDVGDILENGDVIKVYVTHVQRDPQTNEINELFISMRNDVHEKEDLERTAASLKEGDICRGRVSNRSRKAIFIRLNNNLQAFAYISNGLQGRSIPNVGDSVSVRVIHKVENRSNGNPLIQGRIVRNIKYNAR